MKKTPKRSNSTVKLAINAETFRVLSHDTFNLVRGAGGNEGEPTEINPTKVGSGCQTQ